MSFKATQAHVEKFYRDGYVVFEQIIPTSLLKELRAAADVARDIAREKQGPNTQRLQPIEKFAVDFKPFREYMQLPEIHDALTKVLSPRHTVNNTGGLGILLEPADKAWCMNWHRDWGDHCHQSIRGEWEAVRDDIDLFNQINCALYEDTCTWVVPGSHTRLNTPQEVAAMKTIPAPSPNTEGLDTVAAERACLNYCLSMPGAERLLLNAGDFCLYRNSLWHLGNYMPSKRRATLHDFVDTPRYKQFRVEFPAKDRQAREGQLATA